MEVAGGGSSTTPLRVQPLAAASRSIIPAEYIQPPAHRPTPGQSTPAATIPVIDLAAPSDPIPDLRRVCREWGAFHVVNHGVPVRLLQEMKAAALGFFEAPMETKLRYACDAGSAATEGYGSRMLAKEDGVLDWRDYFDHHTLPESRRNPSRWPDFPRNYRLSFIPIASSNYPMSFLTRLSFIPIASSNYPMSFLTRDLVLEYSSNMKDLAQRLLHMISKSLGLPHTYIEEMIGDVYQNLTVSYYSPCPQPELALGLQAHSDMGAITLLVQDDVGGLEIWKDGEWVLAQPLPDAIIVILADQTEIISNGEYISAEHRAVVNARQARLSIATFYDPSKTTKISPAPQLCSEQSRCKFREVLYGDYVSSWYNKGPEGKRNLDALLIPQ